MEKDRPAFDTMSTGASVASVAPPSERLPLSRDKQTQLRELDSGEFTASEMASLRRFQAPPGWKRLPLWQQPFVFIWVFTVLQWGYAKRLVFGLRWAAQRWMKSRPGALLRILEIVMWPLIFIGLSYYSNPSNPMYVNEGFPWPWLGVWLIALRYGTLSGVFSALILLLFWYFLRSDALSVFPRLYILGGAIMTMIAGEFGGLWNTRMDRFREATRYQDDKIERLTRRLYLLKLSHDELEYELVDRPGTLRDALQELRGKLTPETLTGQDALPGSRALLQFLAQYGHIESGGLYEYIDGPKPVLRERAQIGEPTAPDPFDPMLRRAVETGQSVHLQEHLVDGLRHEALLLVAPILDVKERTRGILVVNRMPFLALNPDNLRNIWVLLQAYSEYLRLNSLAQPYTDIWPESPLELRHEFAWLHGLQKDFGLQSWCTLWHCRDSQSALIMEQINQEHTSGEMAWLLRNGREYLVVSLLPFQGIAQVKVQQKRILGRLTRSFDQKMLTTSINTIDISLANSNAWITLKQEVLSERSEFLVGDTA